MGTCKEDSQEQPEASQGPIIVEENFITGPPASRTVIDNLKKLLVQRQHSRESDYENKQKSTSGSNSNSDAAFYSQFSTSSSSDSDSDTCLIFEDISNQENRKSSSGGRRRHRRQRSYSSSSSSSKSPAEKRRRKPTKGRKGLGPITPTTTTTAEGTSHSSPHHGPGEFHSTVTTSSRGDDSANSTSSHKDSSSSDGENVSHSVLPGSTLIPTNTPNDLIIHASSSGTNRLQKFKSRRDRNRKRRRSETNYANDRPTPTTIPTIVISHTEDDNGNINNSPNIITNNTVVEVQVAANTQNQEQLATLPVNNNTTPTTN